MKKVLLLTAAALVAVLAAGVAGTAAAQQGNGGRQTAQKSDGSLRRVQLGLRAGITSRSMELRATDFIKNPELGPDASGNMDYFNAESEMGFHAALVSRIRLTHIGSGRLEMGLYLQPEVIYSQNVYKMQRMIDGNPDGDVSRIRMQSVDIPVMVSFKISIVRLQGGINFNVLYKNEVRKGPLGIGPPLRSTFGWTAGASVDIVAGLVIDGRYSADFKDTQNNIGVPGVEGVSYNNGSVRGAMSNWSLGLSYLF